VTSILAAVAAGGALGSVARYVTVTATSRVFGAGFPLGTLFVNVLGSFAIGFFACFLLRKFPAHEQVRYFLTTGFLGGFTTFSAFSLEVLTLMQRGETQRALLYVLASVVLALIAVFAGYALAQGVTA
jgi:fluoride exporter